MQAGSPWHELGRALLLLGAVAFVAGAVLLFADRIPWLARLPGDIVIRRGRLTLWLPIVTCIVLSVLLTLLLRLLRR
jgi:hypothetical protein